MRKGRRTGNRKRLGRNTRAGDREVEARDRAEVREQRGWTGQLAELDRRLGPGVGAKRERERLELERVVARAMAGGKVAIDRERSRVGALRMTVTAEPVVVGPVTVTGKIAIP